MTDALAIALARAGSKGLPRKNVLDVAGRPCVAWTLDAAMTAERVSRVVLSTDDADAGEIARAMGVEVVERPASLAADDATVDAAARHAAGAIGGDPIVILYANVPVRPVGLIDRAVELLVESGADSVQSYARVGKHHPWWTARIGERGEVSPWEGEVLNHGVYRRQDLPAAYVPDGGVIALTRRALMLEVAGAGDGPHAFFGVDRRGIETAEGEVIDIDGPVDRLVAAGSLTTEVAESTEGARRGKQRGLVSEDLTREVIGAGIEVHKALGPGLLESAYEACMVEALVARGLGVASQVALPVSYGGKTVGVGYRLDLVVDDEVVVEIKSVDALAPVHRAQLLTYLRLSGKRIGLLMNFNVEKLTDGIVRRII